jgi:hypothetical protein
MTPVIYFFLMSLVFFVAPQLVVKQIVYKDSHTFKPDLSLLYLVIAACLPLIWMFLSKELLHMREVNFLQHAVGGGVAVGLVTMYLVQNLQGAFPALKNYLVQLILLYALVSMLGVGNEVLEFSFDYLGVGVFSADRYDTWFDLLANTTGAVFVFLLLSLARVFSEKKIKV